MKSFDTALSIGSGRNDYSVIILSFKTEVRQLRDVARKLMQHDDPMLDPEFLLTSLYKGWQPKVVAGYSGREVVGILYTNERNYVRFSHRYCICRRKSGG
jgi:hypothetical protein